MVYVFIIKIKKGINIFSPKKAFGAMIKLFNLVIGRHEPG